MNSNDNEYGEKGYKESVKHKELAPFLPLAANKPHRYDHQSQINTPKYLDWRHGK
jgi:hypothetical protein